MIETKIYQKLAGKGAFCRYSLRFNSFAILTDFLEGFPRFVWSGIGNFERTIQGERKCLYCHILVTELLGFSLSTMYDDLNHKFTLKMVLLLAVQMVR
jgi:hypothetical protein